MHYKKTIDQSGSGKEYKTAEGPKRASNDDACRCQEVSEMGPKQLFKLMISDLTFWKKKKSG